jgi:hypothetical protein
MSDKEFTYEEKLALVSQGLMDPKEIGVTPVVGENTDQATIDKTLPDPKKKPELGKYVVFQAAEVPLDLRAEWARMDTKILPFDKEEWKQQHKDEHILQAKCQCGTAAFNIENKVTDVVLGLCNLLEGAAAHIREFYETTK